MVLAGHPLYALPVLWQDDDAMVIDDVRALFNPKLEFYNIVVFIIMNFIEISFDEEKKWLIKISTHAD